MALGAHSGYPAMYPPPHLFAPPAQTAAQQQTGAANPVLETPPRTGSFKMRADANEFFALTPPALPFGQPAQYATNNLYTGYEDYSDYYNQEVLQASTEPPRKRFEIVDPKSGTAIEAP